MQTVDQEMVEDAFIDQPVTHVAGIKLRPFSIGSLAMMKRLKLQVTDTSTEEEQARALAGVAWMQSRNPSEIMRAIRAGTADDEIDEFMFSIAISDMAELNAEIARISGQITAASVSIEPKPGEHKDNPPGNS